MPQPAADQGLERLTELETRILRMANLLRSARAERETLARENNHFRRRLADQDQMVRPLRDRVARLEKERESLKSRLEKLLEQVDSLLEAGLEAS
jgi:chromosome segregation ATPase